MISTPPTGYKSRFLKADRRLTRRVEGGHTHQTLFERLASLDDIFMLPGATVPVAAAGPPGQLLVLPIVGGAVLTAAHTPEELLAPGYVYPVPAGCPLTLTNPFEQETVNVLLLRVPMSAAATAAVQELALPLTVKNTLVASENPALPVRVGLYDSRVKGSIQPSDPAAFALCYVLNGSFEIEDRLVQHRDALLLWDVGSIEFEALSEAAILLYLELDRAV